MWIISLKKKKKKKKEYTELPVRFFWFKYELRGRNHQNVEDTKTYKDKKETQQTEIMKGSSAELKKKTSKN